MEVYRAIMLTIRSPTNLISYQAMLRLNLFVEDRLARLVYMKDWCGLIEQDLVPKRVLKHKVDFFIFPRLQSGKRQVMCVCANQCDQIWRNFAT